MNGLREQRRLLLEKKALEDLRARIARESYLSVGDVQERLGLSREKVEALPPALLPYTDLGLRTRSLRRYHPADVLALDARLRAWQEARARGEGEKYLRELEERLEARDRIAEELAETMNAALVERTA